MIHYVLPERMKVHIEVFDLLGQKLAILQSAEMEAGFHKTIWKGKQVDGSKLNKGIYLVSLTIDEMRFVKRVVLME